MKGLDMTDHFEEEELKEPGEELHETPNERFLRLANHRLPIAVKRIKLLGNLSGPAYEYTPEQVSVLFNILQTALDKARAGFDDDVDDEIPLIR
jgi:hypothetical protein